MPVPHNVVQQAAREGVLRRGQHLELLGGAALRESPAASLLKARRDSNLCHLAARLPSLQLEQPAREVLAIGALYAQRRLRAPVERDDAAQHERGLPQRGRLERDVDVRAKPRPQLVVHVAVEGRGEVLGEHVGRVRRRRQQPCVLVAHGDRLGAEEGVEVIDHLLGAAARVGKLCGRAASGRGGQRSQAFASIH
eukprot:7389231-Prymnesium_polylepis.1